MKATLHDYETNVIRIYKLDEPADIGSYTPIRATMVKVIDELYIKGSGRRFQAYGQRLTPNGKVDGRSSAEWHHMTQSETGMAELLDAIERDDSYGTSV